MSSENSVLMKKVPITILCSIMAVGLNYAISFFLAPYITNALGAEAYGFVSLAKTVANYGIVLTTCFNSFSARYITIAFHEADVPKAIRYHSTILVINALLIVISILMSAFIAINIDALLVVPSTLRNDVQILFVFDIVNYALLAFANSFSVSAQIKNKLYYLGIIRSISYAVELLALVLLCSIFSPKVYYVGIALLISTAIIGICNALMTHKLTPELKASHTSFSWNAVKDLFFSGIWNSFNSIGNLLNSGLDLWISNLLLSAQAMGELSIVKTVTTMFTSLFQLVCQPFQPMLLRQYAVHDMVGIITTLKKQIRFSGLVGCMMVTGLGILGKAYYMLWMPGQNSELLQSLTMISVVGLFSECIAYPLFYIYTLTVKNKVPCIVTIVSGLLNVASMYVLIKYTDMGLNVVVGTTSVLGIGTYLIFTPLYSAKCMKMKLFTFVPCMLEVSGLCVLCLVTTKLFLTKMTVVTWTGFLFFGMLIVLTTALIYSIGSIGIKKIRELLVRIESR